MKLYDYYLLKRGLKDFLAVYPWRKRAINRLVECKYFKVWGIIPKGSRKGLTAVAEEPRGAEAIPHLKDEIRNDFKFWLGLPTLIAGAIAAIVSLLECLMEMISKL